MRFTTPKRIKIRAGDIERQTEKEKWEHDCHNKAALGI